METMQKRRGTLGPWKGSIARHCIRGELRTTEKFPPASIPGLGPGDVWVNHLGAEQSPVADRIGWLRLC